MSTLASTFAVASCWESSVTAATQPPRTSIYRSRSRPSFVSDGLPYVFNRFHLLGQITEPFTDSNLGLRPNGKLAFAPARHSGTRRLEMPLDLNVVRFSRRGSHGADPAINDDRLRAFRAIPGRRVATG